MHAVLGYSQGMSDKLSLELQRLYLLGPAVGARDTLVDTEGRVRAVVLGLARPPDWLLLGRVWRGVQAELGLPAPAIAVSGLDAMQLWFSLAEPVPAARAHAFVDGLRQRFLADVDPRRVRLLPAPDASAQAPGSHAALVPALKPTGDWSAFVAPDLAPVFGDAPWLDIQPSAEGQAQLLRVLQPMALADFEAVCELLAGTASAPTATPAPLPEAAPIAAQPLAKNMGQETAPVTQQEDQEQQARQFLLRAMNDESLPMALRIEAAKALLLPSR